MSKYRITIPSPLGTTKSVVVEADYYKVEDGCLHMRDNTPRVNHRLSYAAYPVTKATFAPHHWSKVELLAADAPAEPRRETRVGLTYSDCAEDWSHE